MNTSVAILFSLLSTLALLSLVSGRPDVKVEVLDAQPGNAKLSPDEEYEAHVTLWIEEKDGELTPSGWSTRVEDGGDGNPFAFRPGYRRSSRKGRSCGAVE